MVKVYHSSNIDSVNWKIYSDNIKNVISYFTSGSSPVDVANKLCQFSLFDDDAPKTYVVNIDNWKLTDETTKQCIRELHAISTPVIFALEASTVKNKIFTELNIDVVKATGVTKKAKAQLVHELLRQAKLHLDSKAETALVDLMPDKIDFIKNEITKLQLMDQNSFDEQEIRKIIFDLGDATVFNIIDSWLNGNEEQTIERLNDLISKNITIPAFIPIFALKLIQIKFFLQAKLERWPSDAIMSKQSLPFWQQRIYSDLKPYDSKLAMINQMLDKLYQFDINVKKQKNIPYTQLVKILFR